MIFLTWALWLLSLSFSDFTACLGFDPKYACAVWWRHWWHVRGKCAISTHGTAMFDERYGITKCPTHFTGKQRVGVILVSYDN
jgi:hypothetical protein